VHPANSVLEARSLAAKMLNQRLVTKQTGPEGKPCHKVLISERLYLRRECYFAILMDRAHGGPVMVVSPKGGMDIEAVAEETPNEIHTQAIDIIKGPQPAQTERLAKLLNFTPGTKSFVDVQEQMKKLYKLFMDTDSVQVEINPLVVTRDDLVYCIDAKFNFDENASFRHKEIFDMRDWSVEDPREVAAAKHNLNYIGLDGNIGCMVNGAGLAMSTMDIIKLHGGLPANFLDVGGGANEKQVEEAFKILTGDPKVKAILINIFGGIMKCDIIAQGVVNAAKSVGVKVPIIVRLEGTNVDKGVEILKTSGIKVVTARDLDDAAIKAVASLKK